MVSLFTSQTPSSGDNSDGAPGISLGTAVRFAVDGQVAGIRFFSTVTISGVYTGEFWEVTAADPNGSGGTRLATKTMGAPPTSAGWNTITFDTPVTIDTAKLYKAALFSGDGRYVLTPAFFGSGLVNGDLTSDANGDNPVGLGNLNNGSFTINAAASYPTGGGGSCYFVDVLFTPDSAGVAVTGQCVAVAMTTATVRKVSPATGVAVGVPTARAVAVHVATASGRTVAAGTAQAVAVHRAPVVATCTAVATATAATVKSVAVTGRTVTAATSTAAVVKRVAVTGMTVALATTTAAVAQPGGPVAVVARCVGVALCRARTRGITRRPNTGTTTRPFTGITYRP